MGPIQRNVWRMGQRARLKDVPITDNPYQASEGSWGKRYRQLWEEGWSWMDFALSPLAMQVRELISHQKGQ